MKERLLWEGCGLCVLVPLNIGFGPALGIADGAGLLLGDHLVRCLSPLHIDPVELLEMLCRLVTNRRCAFV